MHAYPVPSQNEPTPRRDYVFGSAFPIVACCSFIHQHSARLPASAQEGNLRGGIFLSLPSLRSLHWLTTFFICSYQCNFLTLPPLLLFSHLYSDTHCHRHDRVLTSVPAFLLRAAVTVPARLSLPQAGSRCKTPRHAFPRSGNTSARHRHSHYH